jgi:hypothetical protein
MQKFHSRNLWEEIEQKLYNYKSGEGGHVDGRGEEGQDQVRE